MKRTRTIQSALQWSDIGRIPNLPTGIYTRRSRDDQSSYSPAAQERIARGYCDSNDLMITEVYLDDDYSGTNGERPDFARMQADARAGRIRVVVVPKMDRFARDVILCLQTYDTLRELGVLVVSVAEPLDFDTPMGRKFLTDAASTAEWYSNNLATEVKKGQREKVEQGGWVGLLPYGYESHFERDGRGERIKGTGRAVFSADEPTARLTFELYATGNYSDLTLAEALNARGLTAVHKGKRVPFSKFTIKSILTNPFYIGIIRYKGSEYRGAHPPLIDRALWDQCQAIRARRAASRDGVPRCGRVPVRGTGGLLSEIAFCARCGGKLHTLVCGDGNSRQRYYRCGERRKYGRAACDAKMIAGHAIETKIFDVLRRLTIPPIMRDAVIALVQERLERPIIPGTSDSTALKAQLARLKDLYELGDIEKAEYLSKRDRIQRQMTNAVDQSPLNVDTEEALRLLGDMTSLLDAASDQQRRALIQQVIAEMWLEKGAVVAIRPTANFRLLVELIANLATERSSPVEIAIDTRAERASRFSSPIIPLHIPCTAPEQMILLANSPAGAAGPRVTYFCCLLLPASLAKASNKRSFLGWQSPPNLPFGSMPAE